MLEFLHHLLLPRHSNNHRPKILHHESLLVIIAFLLFCSSLLSAVQSRFPAVLGIASNISIQDLLNDTNKARIANGLAPLRLDPELTNAATQKAQNMFALNYWAHIAPDGTTPWYFIKNAGYDYLYAGENLARGFTSAQDVVNAWMNSPSHRENMLSPHYQDVGFAVMSGTLTGSDTILVVQEFGDRYVAEQPSVSPAPIAVVLPSPSALPSLVPSPTIPVVAQVSPLVSTTPIPGKTTAVAAIQNQPLVDSRSIGRDLSIFFLVLFIAVLIADAIIVERKQIVRVVAHNLDHIMFFVILLLVAILVGGGLIL